MLIALLEIIIPILGSSSGHQARYFATATVFNPTPRTAIVRRAALYPLTLHPGCTLPAEWSVPSHRAITIQFEGTSTCGGLLPVGLTALSITSEEPVVVTNHVVSNFLETGVVDRQRIEEPTQWIEADVEAVTGAEIEPAFRYRANLLVINPNDFTLVVRMQVRRGDRTGPTREETIDVPPRSSRLHPIEYIRNPLYDYPDYPFGLHNLHEITLVANGRFWAGASSINDEGGCDFRKAIPLQR